MESVATIVCLSFLHSLWQSALLAGSYFFINAVSVVSPAGKRNLLFKLLAFQLLLTIGSIILLINGGKHFLPSISTVVIFPAQISNTFLQSLSLYFLYAYILFVLFKCISTIYQYKHFRRFNSKNFIKPSAEIRTFTQLKSFELGLKKVQIFLCDKIAAPFTYGFLSPVILFPVALINQLSVQETEALIIHELTHIRNNDYLLNFFLVIMETIFCFNPFIYFFIKRIKLEREKSCDLQVIQYEYSSLQYAETLLKTARHRASSNTWEIAAVSNKNELLKRIQFFTGNVNLMKMKNTFNPLSYTVVLFIAFLSLFLLADDNQTSKDSPVANSTFHTLLFPLNGSASPELKSTEATASFSVAATQLKPSMLPSEKLMSKKSETRISPEKNIDENGNAEPSYFIPVQNVAPVPDKEVMIVEENPATGKITTIVYKSSFVNGNWTAIPVVTITEMNPSDSCKEITPSTSFSSEQ